MPNATLSVNLAALRANYRLLRERHAKKNIASVVKANAYGLGIAEVSKALAKEGCGLFFVATLEEAVELRGILPRADIAVFNGIFKGEERTFTTNAILPVVNSNEQLEIIRNPNVPTQDFILHVDTGMTRLGISTINAGTPRPRMLMSHLACASDPEHPKNAEQLARLKEAARYLPGTPVSFVNSSGHFLPPEYHFDIGRPGCALYGINPTEGNNPMQHVATLSAPILQIRELDRDETVGYGATFSAPRGSRIAIVGLGYADGYFRLLSNEGSAFVAGHKVPVVGRVSMDMVALDVTMIPDKLLGTHHRAEFINELQPVDVIAQQCGTIGYEIFTRIGRRVQRAYTA